MKKILLILLICNLSVLSSSAQQVRMRDLFAQAPDSIFPLLTTNNRLDCIDFIENNMLARVKNRFDDETVLEVMTPEYMRLKTCDRQRIECRLLPANDSVSVICMVSTVFGPAPDSNVRFYDTRWNMIPCHAERPAIDDFINPDSANADIDEMKIQLQILPLMRARLNPDSNTLTWELQSSQLSKDIKKAASQCLQPVVMEWKEGFFVPAIN